MENTHIDINEILKIKGISSINYAHDLAVRIWETNQNVIVTSNANNEINRNQFQKTSTTQQLIRKIDKPTENSSITSTTSSNLKSVSQKQNDGKKKRISPIFIPKLAPNINNMQLFPPLPDALPDAVDTEFKSNSVFEVDVDPMHSRFKELERLQEFRENIKQTTASKSDQSSNNLILIKRKPRSTELMENLPDDMKKMLDTFSSNYSYCLNTNMTTNLLREVSFLCRLLVSNYDCIDPNNILSSLPARIYFVTKVIESQLFLLSFLGRDICQNLISSWAHRIPKSLRTKLNKLIDECDSKLFLLEELESKSPIIPNPCVNFQSESDGKSNFLDQRDFHAFCKQRDFFYSIKNVWANGEPSSATASTTSGTNNRNNRIELASPASNFIQSSSYDSNFKKVRLLFNLNSSPTNLAHFATLFCNQFILDMFLNEERNKLEAVEGKKALEPFIKSNPSKFKQLSSRFSPKAKLNFNESRVEEEVENMEFQKYFIQIANSPSFNQNLIDKIVYEIHQLEYIFDQKGIAETSSIIEMMKKARLLAQLLGFVYFLPYHDPKPLNYKLKKSTEEIAHFSKLISLRSYQSPPIDIFELLKRSLKQKRLVFTLTWVIEFLSKADRITFLLPKFLPLITYISFLYRHVLVVSVVSEPRKIHMCLENMSYLRFLCAKLFDLEYFQEPNQHPNYFEEFKLDQDQFKNYSNEEILSLDLQPIIGLSLFNNSFSSLLFEISEILRLRAPQQISTSSNKSSSSKRISLQTNSPKKEQVSEYIKIQLELEASFFSNYQPNGCRYVVDFIVERVYSNFIKELKNNILPHELKLFSTQNEKDQPEIAFVQFKQNIKPKIYQFVQPKCTESINMLIDNAIGYEAIEICKQITIRKCIDTIYDWIEKFPKEYFQSNLSKAGCISSSGQPRILPSFNSISYLNRLLRNVHSGKTNNLNLDQFFSIINTDDDKFICTSIIISTTISLVLALAAHVPYPSLILNPERLYQIVRFWRKNSVIDFKIPLLCPRNLMILEQSRNSKETWIVIGQLLEILIKEELLDQTDLQNDCMSLLREEWSPELCQGMSIILSNLKNYIGNNSTNPNSSDSENVVDWIGWCLSGKGDE